MTAPTPDQLAALVARLRNVDRDLATRLARHLERDRRGGSVVADGYPAATLGGGTSGSGGDVTLTSVESAVEARLSGGARDTHQSHTRGALRALLGAVKHLDECYAHVAALDLLDKADDPTAASCTHHATHGHNEPTGPSREAKERGLCNWCADFADRNDGVRPPVALIERKAQGHRVTAQQEASAMGRSFGVTLIGARLAARLHR